MNYREVGLSAEEFALIGQLLKRVPNDLELGLFGVLWSEHCSYKSSKNLLAWLPGDGPAVVQGPGENAGIVALNDQVHVAFKVESHNHPSFVEPLQGAATGVGGILRDIVAMGARPVALADSLRFGTDGAAQDLQHGVVEGIGAYGNAIGIPTVTGEVGYAPVYDGNPLVNVMAVGLLPAGQAVSASGAREGSYLLLLGQATGRDGIHGASLLASQDFGEDAEHMRPTVQVGDPFMGKLLMESTLEIVATGLADAVQDLGAAGLASSISEMAYHSDMGAEIWIDEVPCREPAMSPYDIMLSETQERMLVVIAPEHMDAVSKILEHWELPFRIIGKVTGDKILRIVQEGGVEAAALPPELLSGVCPRKPALPALADKIRREEPASEGVQLLNFDREWALQVLGSPDCRSRAQVYERYDSMILTNTIWGPAHDLAVIGVQGSQDGLAIAIAGPGRYSARDAYSGGMGAVCRALAPLVAQGAEPLGLTDGINAGNPDEDAVFAQLTGLIAGIADASRAFSVPVTGGNVSLHNVTAGSPIWPTAVIGAVGRHLYPHTPVADGPEGAGQDIIWVNPAGQHSLGGSVFEMGQQRLREYPRPQLERLAPAFRVLAQIIREHHRSCAARAIADGGLFVALSRALLASADSSVGLSITLAREDIAGQLFSEVAGQFVLFCPEKESAHVMEALGAQDIFSVKIGRTTADSAFTVRAGRTYVYDRNELAVTYAWGYRG